MTETKYDEADFAYFSYQRSKQLEHVHVAQANKNLKETSSFMDSILSNLLSRGVKMDEVAETSQQVMESSDLFLQSAQKAASCLPEWWWIPQCLYRASPFCGLTCKLCQRQKER
jgi:hypothetical protein